MGSGPAPTPALAGLSPPCPPFPTAGLCSGQKGANCLLSVQSLCPHSESRSKCGLLARCAAPKVEMNSAAGRPQQTNRREAPERLEVLVSYKLRKAPPRHTRRGRWFGGVRPSFSGSVCETVWSSPARNAGRGARRPPPSRAICSDAFRGSKSDLRPLRLPGNVSGQAPPIERAKLDAQQSGIAIEGRRASWRRREPRSRHC